MLTLLYSEVCSSHSRLYNSRVKELRISKVESYSEMVVFCRFYSTTGLIKVFAHDSLTDANVSIMALVM